MRNSKLVRPKGLKKVVTLKIPKGVFPDIEEEWEGRATMTTGILLVSFALF